MKLFFYDKDYKFPVWINRDMVVSVEPDKNNEDYTHIKLVNGYVVVYGYPEDVVKDLQ